MNIPLRGFNVTYVKNELSQLLAVLKQKAHFTDEFKALTNVSEAEEAAKKRMEISCCDFLKKHVHGRLR